MLTMQYGPAARAWMLQTLIGMHPLCYQKNQALGPDNYPRGVLGAPKPDGENGLPRNQENPGTHMSMTESLGMRMSMARVSVPIV